MSDQPKQPWMCANKLGRIFLFGLEEVMGRKGLNSLLPLAEQPDFSDNFPANNLAKEYRFEDLSKILVTLEGMYGPQGGRGVALRSGRACFKHMLHEFGSELGLDDPSFRLLPTDQKLPAELERLARVFNTYSDQQITVQEDAEAVSWQIERCPACWGRSAESPACHLFVGLLQETSYWVSGGKMFSVVEKSCIAQGDPVCTVVVSKQPFDH